MAKSNLLNKDRTGMISKPSVGSVFSGTDLSSFDGSKISRAMITAYLSTNFRVFVQRPFTLQIGRRNAILEEFLRIRAASSCAVITAWNPYSELASDVVNETAQAELEAALDLLSLDHVDADGSDPTNEWPAEPSRLVLGLDLKTAVSLGRRFAQNGIVWVQLDDVPTLILLR
jgi:hypothetical protein